MLEYRYDTQLLIEGENLDEDEINDYFVENFKGDCLLAVGDEELIKIHYHTNEPWKVLEYCRSLGEIYDIDGNRIFMRSSEGRVLSRPLEAYPELEEATTEQRNNFTIEDEGRAIRWEELDADMHISSFYETSEPNEQNEVAVMFKRCPWLNVSEVARAIGINKSLLARYIYGISKPSEQRVMQIREAFHQFAKELQTV